MNLELVRKIQLKLSDLNIELSERIPEIESMDALGFNDTEADDWLLEQLEELKTLVLLSQPARQRVLKVIKEQNLPNALAHDPRLETAIRIVDFMEAKEPETICEAIAKAFMPPQFD